MILMAIRWYLAYPLSYRHVEDFLKERGLSADHAMINRWVVRYDPLLEMKARKFRRSPTKSWRMGETYIKIKSKCYYYYRVVTNGDTIDCFLPEKHDLKDTKAFLDKAIAAHGLPEKVNVDKCGALLAALEAVNAQVDSKNRIPIRQIKYLNNLVEQDHREIKRITRPTMGFQTPNTASVTLAGIELCHMIKKGQLTFNNSLKQFYALAC